MAFWKRKKRGKKGKESRVKTATNSSPPPTTKRRFLPTEVKVLAVEACEAGLTPKEVSEIIGAAPATITKWMTIKQKEGLEALARKASNPGTRRLCSQLEGYIKQFRMDNPDAGVRRIRDELRRHEGLEVSAESVRQVVNRAGLGNPPPVPKRKPAQIRRFERQIPNAMWQIDIFTFELKRMYRVYLVSIIDDQSRYIVGHGLSRRQASDAVIEVVTGAIGEWGAPREIQSDNGRQHVTWRGKSTFQKTMTRQGIQHC